MACNSVERFKQGARVGQTTDHATEKWVAIAEIACARAISFNNTASEGSVAVKWLKDK